MTDTLADSLPDILPDSTTDKKKTRQDAKVTRLDVRLPNDLHATIEAIAKANGEPRHHITGNIILTPTVVKLIRLGVSSLSGEYQTLADISTTTGQVSDNLTPRMEAIEHEVNRLKKSIVELQNRLNDSIGSDNLPAIVPDIKADSVAEILPNINLNNLTDNLADTVSDIKIKAESKPSQANLTAVTTKPEGALTISNLIEKLGKTRQAIEQRRDSEAGLDDWGYKAKRVGRNWYYSLIDPLSE